MTSTPGPLGSPAADDVAFSRRVLQLPPEPSAPRSARRLVEDLLLVTGHQEWADAAALACTELVTNAVLHAHSTITVTIEVAPTEMYVGVSDASQDLPRQRSGDSRATTGRGMLLVSRLAAAHGVRVDGAGKTVWFTLRSPAEATEASVDDLLSLWTDDADADRGAAVQGPVNSAGPAPSDPGPDAGPDPSDPPADAPTGWSRVQLLGLPATLWLATEEHHRTMLRELVLYLAEQPGTDVDMLGADAALTLLGDAVSAAVEHARAAGQAQRPLPDGHPAHLPSTPRSVDLDLPVPPWASRAFADLQDTLDLAERLSADGQLLARPGLPEVVAVRDWACEQVLTQCAGSPAVAWPGTDHERFIAQDTVHDATWSWDVGEVSSSSRAVVAADDSNRIVAVSAAMAELVGWQVDDLVGRRVVTLIPPRLREAHVAGFSRHLSTGEARLLGIPLELPLLRADGTEMPCAVLIEEAAAEQGRRLYLAWFDTPSHPAQPADD